MTVANSTLAQTLAAHIRASIQEGTLKRRARIPSSRSFAVSQGVSRNTVTEAFSILIAEGYLEARSGSGTYVSSRLPEQFLNAERGNASSSHGDGGKSRRLRSSASKRGMSIASAAGPGILPFAPGIPDISAFPFKEWLRLLKDSLSSITVRMLSYGAGAGNAVLREAIAEHLCTTRALRCSPRQVIVTNGTSESIQICAACFSDAGDTVIVEDPCYPHAVAAFRAAGLRIVPATVDCEGMQPASLSGKVNPALIYTTPSRQYPLGHRMPAARRRELVDFAAAHGATIVEDDYDSEFSFESRPARPISADFAECPTILLGSFSKVMFPGLRLSYLIVPDEHSEFAEKVASMQLLAARHAEQIALARFIQEGRLAAHLLRMRNVYRAKHLRFTEIWNDSLGDLLPLAKESGGMHAVARLPAALSDVAIVAQLRELGIGPAPLSRMYLGATVNQGLLLGFGSVGKEALNKLTPVMCKILASALKRSG